MAEKIKVICIGDSTSLPGHDNSYEDTWFYKLKTGFPNIDFISVFRRGITTQILVTEGGGYDDFPMGADCLEFYEPQIVVLNLGIVDCAPRLLNRFGNLTIRFLPNFAKKRFIELFKKIRGRRSSNTLVSKEQFQYNLTNFFERCLVSDVKILIVLCIPVPDRKMISKNPGIIKNVEEYNNILHQIVVKYPFIKALSPLDSQKYTEDIFEDGYHPNPLGNQIVFQELEEILINIINK